MAPTPPYLAAKVLRMNEGSHEGGFADQSHPIQRLRRVYRLAPTMERLLSSSQ